MQINYDPEVDVLTVRLREREQFGTDEVAPGMIVDFDDQGLPLVIEILNATRVLNREKLELPFAVTVG
jgi:uncharacterized protein YuzE